MPDSTTKRHYTPRELKTYSCAHCGENFESRGLHATYCSSRCRDRVRYERDREKRVQAVRDYRVANAEAIKQRVKARREADKEKFAAQARQSYLRRRVTAIEAALRYQKENPHIVARTRNKRRGAEQKLITSRDLARLLMRHDGRCVYCGVELLPWGKEHENSLQWDHIVPLFRGGRDAIGNLAPACRFCNHSKNRKTVMEWRKVRSDDRWSD